MSAHDLEGVRIVSLKLLPNAKGRLMEVQRADDSLHPGFGQVYITSTYPGVVKAWYRHHQQIDQIALVKGLLKLVLFDVRTESATAGRIQEIIIEERAPRLVQIPPGLWHGFQAMGPDECFLLHLNSRVFHAEQPDEDRLPPDSAEIPYQW
jgi:dTDP-4-dehydrorhamnose 3,5-epimerase